jgi:hypothetical protein
VSGVEGLMLATAMFVLLCATPANGSSGGTSFNPIEMAIVAKTDQDNRWCAEPAFEATIKNSATAPVWLELGEPASELVVTSYSACQSAAGGGGCEAGATATADDWGSVEDLRRPGATLVKPGESVMRVIKLEDVRLRAGRATVDVTVRIHGSQNLASPKVRTYRPEAKETLVLRRIGPCLEVRRLTSH